MKVVGLDGKDYNWKPKGNKGKRSKLHKRAVGIIKELFPFDVILEEVSLPGSATTKNNKLRCDIFVPNREMFVEVHGEQHFKYNNFYYKNKMAFYRAQGRDRTKREWFKLNELALIELSFDETDEQWKEKLKW